MLSSGMQCYHLELMLSSRTQGYHLELILWYGSNVIILCYHLMLSSGMITPPLFIFPENFTHSTVIAKMEFTKSMPLYIGLKIFCKQLHSIDFYYAVCFWIVYFPQLCVAKKNIHIIQPRTGQEGRMLLNVNIAELIGRKILFTSKYIK